MAAISRANELKQLLPGLNALFGEEYTMHENQHEEIYVTENSERSFEEELKLSGFGAAPVKDEGSAITYDTCLLYTSPSPRDRTRSRMPSSA